MSNEPIGVLGVIDGILRRRRHLALDNRAWEALNEARAAIAELIEALRDSHSEVVRLRDAMFRVYSVAANGGDPNDAIEKMRDVMDAPWSGDKAMVAIARATGEGVV